MNAVANIAFSMISSDADSDVLADYVLALVRTDAPDDENKRNSVENLEDFLRERAYDRSHPSDLSLILSRHATLRQ